MTWIQGDLPGENISINKLAHAFSYRGRPMISRTTDGGAHWSSPKAMTNANLYAQGNQIVVLPDGTLLDVQAILFKGAGIQPNLNGVYMAVMRSNDDGVHWSSPIADRQDRHGGVISRRPAPARRRLPARYRGRPAQRRPVRHLGRRPRRPDQQDRDGALKPTAASTGRRPSRHQPPQRHAVLQPRDLGRQRRRARRALLRHLPKRRRPPASRPTSTSATPATAEAHGAHRKRSTPTTSPTHRSPAATSSATTRGSRRTERKA